MKCNKDIDPIKRNLGMTIETYLLRNNVNKHFRYVAIDKDGTIVLFIRRPKPIIFLNKWISNCPRVVMPCKFAIGSGIQYINENWKDLLFTLGCDVSKPNDKALKAKPAKKDKRTKRNDI